MARPDYLIIGAQRCGTTSMANYLRQHPRVVAPVKETHYFTSKYSNGLQWYGRVLGKRRPGTVHGEKSADYLPAVLAPKRVKADPVMARGTKFIVLLRDPVDRIWSNWFLWKHLGRGDWPFSKFVHAPPDDWARLAFESKVNAPLYRGHYAEHLKRWLTYFPDTDRYLILCSEDFFEAPMDGYNKVLDFLGLPPFRPDLAIHGAMAQGKMHWKTRAWLQDYYRPHNDALQELLGWEVNWNEGYG